MGRLFVYRGSARSRRLSGPSSPLSAGPRSHLRLSIQAFPPPSPGRTTGAANKKWLVRYNAAMALPVSERHAPALLNDPRSSAFSRYSSRSDVAEKFVNFGP
jgi:hypothetical protein